MLESKTKIVSNKFHLPVAYKIESFISIWNIFVHDTLKLYSEEVGDPSVKFNERKIGADNEVGVIEWNVWIWFELKSITQLLYGNELSEPEIL